MNVLFPLSPVPVKDEKYKTSEEQEKYTIGVIGYNVIDRSIH